MARELASGPTEVGSEEQPLLPISAPRRQRDRQGKKTIAGHFDPPLARAVAILAAKEDRTIVSLLGEALDDLLSKYGQEV